MRRPALFLWPLTTAEGCGALIITRTFIIFRTVRSAYSRSGRVGKWLTAGLTQPSGSVGLVVCFILSEGISCERNFHQKWLIRASSSRQLLRIAMVVSGSRSGVMACTGWRMAFGHLLVAAKIFHVRVSSVNSPTAWAVCGLVIRTTSWRYWLEIGSECLLPMMDFGWVTSPQSMDALLRSGSVENSDCNNLMVERSTLSLLFILSGCAVSQE